MCVCVVIVLVVEEKTFETEVDLLSPGSSVIGTGLLLVFLCTYWNSYQIKEVGL